MCPSPSTYAVNQRTHLEGSHTPGPEYSKGMVSWRAVIMGPMVGINFLRSTCQAGGSTAELVQTPGAGYLQ